MITLVSGTNRPESVTRQVVDIYKGMLDMKKVASRIIDLVDLPSDFIISALYDNKGKNSKFEHIQKLMLGANKFVFFIPEHNGSFPRILKTFIDGLSYPDTFYRKKCAPVGISAGVQGSVLAMSHITDIFNYAKMHVLAEKPKLLHIENHLKDDEIINPLFKSLFRGAN